MNSLVVSFVNVGQGDCTTIVDGNGVGFLVDCPRGKDAEAAAELLARGCKWLRYAIVSHSDEDHAGGVLDTIERMAERFDGMLLFNVDSLLTAPVAETQSKAAGQRRRAFLLRASEYDPRIDAARAGPVVQTGGISWQILAPTYGELIAAWRTGNPNLASAVIVVSAFGQSVIIGGDAQIVTWERIQSEIPKDGTVRWPHHGGSLSGGSALETQKRLFDITGPKRAVVSVGSNNSLDHPTKAFFEARAASGAELICTQASRKCVKGDGAGGVCAGTIRISLSEAGEAVTSDSIDHAARVRELGAGQCVSAQLNSTIG